MCLGNFNVGGHIDGFFVFVVGMVYVRVIWLEECREVEG